MNHIFLLLIFGLLSAVNARAETCVFFMEDGSFMKPQADQWLVDDLTTTTKRWSSCAKKIYLVSVGKETVVYEERTGKYRPFTDFPVDAPATIAALKKTLSSIARTEKKGEHVRLYFGDHGNKRGTVATDGNLTPDTLRPLMKALWKAGLAVRAHFDHCYAGIMQTALYSGANGEVYACGLSTANKLPSYTLDSPILAPIHVADEAVDNQVYASDDSRENMQNHYVTTADRFLEEYVNTSYPKICVDCAMNDIAGLAKFDSGIVAAVANEDLLGDIAHIDEQYRAFYKNSDIDFADLGFCQNYSNADIRSIHAEADFAAKTSNQSFWKSKKNDTAFLKIMKDKDALYAKRVTDSKAGKCKIVVECADFAKYQTLSQQITQIKKQYMDKTRVSPTSLVNVVKPENRQISVTALQDK